MVYIHTRRFKEHSHIPIEEIKRQQAKHKKDLIQPRIGGELNPEYVEEYGDKNLNLSDHDWNRLYKHRPFLADKLNKHIRERNG